MGKPLRKMSDLTVDDGFVILVDNRGNVDIGRIYIPNKDRILLHDSSVGYLLKREHYAGWKPLVKQPKHVIKAPICTCAAGPWRPMRELREKHGWVLVRTKDERILNAVTHESRTRNQTWAEIRRPGA